MESPFTEALFCMKRLNAALNDRIKATKDIFGSFGYLRQRNFVSLTEFLKGGRKQTHKLRLASTQKNTRFKALEPYRIWPKDRTLSVSLTQKDTVADQIVF